MSTTISEGHLSVAPLRDLLDPIAALTTTVREKVVDNVQTVILFGSIARGEATLASNIDLVGQQPEAATAAKALRELLSAKGDVWYGVALVTGAKAVSLIRRARSLVDLGVQVVRLGR